MFPLKNKRALFSWSLVTSYMFLERRENHFKMLMGMCFVPKGIAQDKSVSMFKYWKRNKKAVTTVSNANCPDKFQTFPLRTKNQKSCCLLVTAHIALPIIRVLTANTKNTFRFWNNFPPITIKHTWILANKGKDSSSHGKTVSNLHWLIQWTRNSSAFSF